MQRPTSVTVFGVLNIVFSVLGVVGIAFSAVLLYAMPQLPGAPEINTVPDGWMIFSLVWGVLGATVLFVSGIGLLLLRPWGRLAAIGYAIATIGMTVVGLAMHWIYVVRPTLALLNGQDGPPPEAVGAAIGGFVGGCIGPIYPLLLWYFMTRPNVLAAFGGIPAADAESPWSPAMPGRGAQDSSNPYLAPQTDATRPWTGAVAPSTPESIVETFVPTRNGPALASYYLGLFALLPCLGFPLGVAAVYFGVQGLRRVRENPAVRGGAHAWVGVICGGLFGLFNFALVILLIIGGIAAATG
ncbi:MAG: hypothetical protein WD063_16385 [Pirellulales bacterium]